MESFSLAGNHAVPTGVAAAPGAAVSIPGYTIEAVLHRSRLRTIYAATRLADGVAVAIKTLSAEYPLRNDVVALQREFRIVQRLQPVDGVIRTHALETFGNGNVAMVVEQFGRSLADEIAARPDRRMPLDDVFAIAIGIAEIMAGLHELDVVHKNIEPRSLLIDHHGNLRLIDFGIASELSLERLRHSLANQPAGTLPYMSPEQSGRMNRDVDYRSDYYSLGITLFELLTGQLPFQGNSVLEWVHSHISKVPPSPADIDPSIPAPLAAMVLKLIAKNAEDRYQSSFGLISDLTRCRRELAQTGEILPFALGQRDISRRFQIPQKLYGRETEQAMLQGLFEQVAAGNAAFCMVSGYSGIGKTALVNELNKPLVRQKGYLIQGKFDQFQRSTPYSAVAAAFRDLVQQLLEEPDDRQRALRERLLAAIGANGQVLIDLLPDLELIIGPQPPVPVLPQTESQNRFHIAFLNFVRAITAEQPLVVFLDDLQFGDASTFNLIRWLAAARDLSHLLLIGAYRSNEVEAGHSLQLLLDEIAESRLIHELSLRPLDLAATNQLVADTLSCPVESCAPLSRLLHESSLGNPFFLSEILKSLYQSRAIAFAPSDGRWRWDMEAIRQTGLHDDVVALMADNLRRLDPATQRVLQLASCIGNSFDLRTLAIINEQSQAVTSQALLPALRRHMVVPLNDDYKFVGNAPEGGIDATARDHAAPNPTYQFQHDRVQQAAYALIAPDHKQAVHLSIGRLVQQHASAAERQDRLIDIVGHLNAGRALIADDAERLDLARLNLAAGIQAQRSSAYESALEYLRTGQELLPGDSWAAHYALTMALATEYQQCAYLTGRTEEAEIWIERMLDQARTNLEKAEILSQRTRQYATTGKMEASMRAAIMGLSLLGMRIAAEPNAALVRRERASVRRNLGQRRIADLIDAPTLADRTKVVAIRLLMEIFPPAFLSGNGALLSFIVLRSVNLSLRHGNSQESAFAYAAYGMLLCGRLEDPATGYEYGKLAVAMNDRLADIGLKSRVIYVYSMFIHHWSNHWSTMTPWFRRGIESGYQSGDLLYLAYSAQDCVIWDPKLDLETAAQEHASYLGIVRDCAYQDSLDSGTLFLQMQRNMLGLTDSPTSLSDSGFDEQSCHDAMLGRQFMTGVANYHIYKTEVCFLHRDLTAARVHVAAQDRLIASSMSLPQLARYYIVAFLTLTATIGGADAAEAKAIRTRLRADLRRMAQWAKVCPANFRHLELTMRGELARIDGRTDVALQFYEQAMDCARTAEFRRDEAVANELAARNLIDAGRRKAGEGYLRAARHLFARWGARRKVEQLDAEFAAILQPRGEGKGDSDLDSGAIIDSVAIDMASVVKASQAISGELVLERLWATTMLTMLENAGGQRGCFVIRRNGRLIIEGLIDVDALPGSATPAIIAESAEGVRAIPASIVYHVLHTNTPVVLNDAVNSGRFSRDTYIAERQPQSVLCVPLVRQGRFEGAIYMENSLATGVFTHERIEVIKLLAAQVSISMENAQLYADQSRLIQAQSRFVPRQFLESLDRHDIALVNQGEHVAKTLSIMFADLRDFTPLAEQIDARSVIELLNRYFVAMEPQITAAGGFIDSFAGDEIQALFDGGADGAVRAGINMWRALEGFNARSMALGRPELTVGIGVNTGPVVLGVVGGNDRIQCSVIGDTVNLASRIEQLTKVYQARFLISDTTHDQLADPGAFEMRIVDRVAVKGKQKPVVLYEVLDVDPPARRAAKISTRARLGAAIARYNARDFASAQTLFAVICRDDPDDAVPALFLARSERYFANPPPLDWVGIEKLDHK